MRIRTGSAEDGGGGGAPPTEYHSLASRAMEFDAGGSSQHCGLRRRGQSVDMAQAPSRKTADEVWGDIQQRGKKKKKMTMAMVMNNQLQSLDEMTLEDFLVKAGEAAECSDGNRIDQMGSFGFRPYMHWLHHQQQQHHHHHQPPLMAAGAGAILASMYNDNQGNASSPSAVSPGRKRAAATDVISEKTAERRKKRMIKNRESAARSRARKQAYTNELENKISLLEAENERLRTQKELESEVHVPQPEPKYHLRRARSAPF